MISKTILSQHNKQITSGYILVILMTFLVFSFQIDSEFELKDDHRILRYSGENKLHEQVPGAKGSFLYLLWDAIVIDATQTSRFRPLTWLAEIGLPKLLGLKPINWRVSWLFMAIIIASCLYLLGLRIFEDYRIGAVFALMVMLAPDPGPTAVWYKPGVKAEAIGTLFIILAMFVLSHAPDRKTSLFDILAFILTILASLSKESFVLLLPAIMFFRVWLEACVSENDFLTCIKKLKYVLLAYVVFFLILIGIILFIAISGGSESYGGKSLHLPIKFFLSNLRMSLIKAPSLAVWFIPVIGATILGLQKMDIRRLSYEWLIPMVLFVLWVAPQFVLYATRGGMWDHYWLPCVVGFAGINAAGILFIIRHGKSAFRFGVISLVLLWSVNAARIDVMAIMNYGERTKAQQMLVHSVASKIPRNGRLVIVSDMSVQSELAFSLLYFLGNAGADSSIGCLYDTLRNNGEIKAPFRAGFTKSKYFPQAPLFDKIIPECFDAIIFLDHPQEIDSCWQAWYKPSIFAIHSAMRPQNYLSLKKMKLVTHKYFINFAINRIRDKRKECLIQ